MGNVVWGSLPTHRAPKKLCIFRQQPTRGSFKLGQRHVSVKVRGLVLTATYMPVSSGSNDVEIEGEMEVLAEHLKWAKHGEMVIIGGDFNAHVGGNDGRKGVCGKFGLRASNRQGTKLLDWCEANGLSHVNTFFNHRRRGTWFSNLHKRWYELDGFLMKNQERQRYVKKVCTIGEACLSDHKPKRMRIELGARKWREVNQARRVPRIEWEKLADEGTAARFRTRMEEKMTEIEEGGRFYWLGSLSGKSHRGREGSVRRKE